MESSTRKLSPSSRLQYCWDLQDGCRKIRSHSWRAKSAGAISWDSPAYVPACTRCLLQNNSPVKQRLRWRGDCATVGDRTGKEPTLDLNEAKKTIACAHWSCELGGVSSSDCLARTVLSHLRPALGTHSRTLALAVLSPGGKDAIARGRGRALLKEMKPA